GIMLGETCTATRRPVAWDPWLAQEIRRASGLTAVIGGLGSGKALALDTPLPTPTGWTVMGDVGVGDELLDRDGKPTRVVAATEVMYGRPCYDVVFSDGSVIRADARHEWLTTARPSARQSAGAVVSDRVPNRAHIGQPRDVFGTSTVTTTEEIAVSLLGGSRQHAVRAAGSLPVHALPVHAYPPAAGRRPYHFIVDVVPVESVPVRCVQVDNADHLYLAGESCIPTHNSFLTGLIVYKTLRAGARWTVLDPSGPLAELANLPELAPFSRHINLLRADPGILNPYRVVAEPKVEHFLDDTTDTGDDPEKAWRRERSLAAATRRRLVLDVLTGLLPFEVSRLPHTRIVLLRAVREVGGAPDRDPAMVIDVLRRHAQDGEDHAGVVADFLEERRELPQAALLFPDQTRDDPWQADRDYRLTVLTMQGMTLPRPGSPREEWTDGESLAVELLNLASWLTQRTIYDANRNIRKGVALDESHFLSQVPTGKVLIDRLARDSRKFNVRALFASQLAGDLLRVSGFASLVNAVFVGRTDDEEAQVDALRLLRVPTGVGYEQMLGTLSPRPRHDDRPDDTPRQFVFADGHGGVEKIRIDMEAPHLAHLAEALDTNPDAARVSVSGAPTAGPNGAVAGSTNSAVAGPTNSAVAGPTNSAVAGPTNGAVAGPTNGARSLATAHVPVPPSPGTLDDEEIDLLDDLDELDPVGDVH
nr:ATP-binding protein [Actinomycetota bacterium]